MPSSEILCVGEVLWDALPAGLFLGGAPFNVACHLRATGVPVTLVSRVGMDRLGDEALRRVARYGVGTDLVQRDGELPTGFVHVTFEEDGTPSYDIVEPAAWDAIETTDELLQRAALARAVVFGSLAQRNAVTRATIERMWETEAMRVFDVNLRPPYDDRAIVRRSLEHAELVKVSAAELRQLATWFALPGAAAGMPGERAAVEALAESFGVGTVCVTRGREGSALWRDGRWTEQPGFEVEVRDTVGSGDAFLAVLLAGLLAGAEDGALLHHASLAGAYVATQVGAVPPDQAAAVPQRPAAADRPRRRSRGGRA